MKNQTFGHKVVSFFLTKIIIGIAAVGGMVALVEWLGRLFLENTPLHNHSINIIISISDAAISLVTYIIFFNAFENRRINELSASSFGKNALLGFTTGFLLQSVSILFIYLAGGYLIISINPISHLIPAFNTAITAGFVSEIVIRGIFFRLIEEKFGTKIALLIITLVFASAHLNVADATILSIFSTAMQAGFLISASYVFTRSLWFVIFFHFAWDFVEPGIFGAINTGNTIA
ncbi:MAG: family intrarane metalloprotease [Sphingobacteriales bacterium]|nr:family intrarane metalloprotease [Sphingobacteriales bacterium]